MTSSQPTLIALNDVLEERADDFEEWLRRVVVPVVTQHRPHAADRWRVLRADTAEDGVVAFAFLFEGPPEDAELDSLLEAAFGADGARRELDTLAGMLRGDQRTWSFSEVSLGG